MQTIKLTLSTVLLCGACCMLSWADDPTSRYVSLAPIPGTSLPASSSGNAVQFEVWDVASGGDPNVDRISSEAHTVDTDGNSNITNDTGSLDLLLGRPGGLDPAKYPPGQSRYLDVKQSGTSVLTARIPLYASAFSVSPGPQGPAGPKGDKGDTGPQGQQGPPGPISNVIAGTGLAGGGTTSTVTVAIADGGVGTTQLAANAVTGAKVAAPLVMSASIPTNGVIQAANTSANGYGIYGSSDAGWGVVGISNTGTGVSGQASASSGNTIGVRGVSFSPTGIGVSGEATHIGIFGRGSPAGLFQGDVQVLGNFSAANVSGNGAGLTSLPAANLAGTVPSAALSGNYGNVLAFSNPGDSFTGNGGGLTNLNATSLTNGIRVQQNSESPNIVSGFSGNNVAAGIVGATIAGGGDGTFNFPNAVMGNYGTVGGGAANSASGNYATVAGGEYNSAAGNFSFAAGVGAIASQDGCFVWIDAANVGDRVACTSPNRFIARATGGVFFFTSRGNGTGVQLAAGGGSWSSVSDRNVKEHFAAVDARQVLTRVTELPIQSWNYKSQDASIRHIGPMAQDFYAAFHVGEDDRHITEIDEAGVALVAIQGLNQRLEDEIKAQRAQISRQDDQIRRQAEQIRELTTALRQFTTAYAEPERRK